MFKTRVYKFMGFTFIYSGAYRTSALAFGRYAWVFKPRKTRKTHPRNLDY